MSLRLLFNGTMRVKRASLADLALYAQFGTEPLGKLFSDEQIPGPSPPYSLVPELSTWRKISNIEFEKLRRDADAGIGDREFNGTAALIPGRNPLTLQCPSLGGEFDRVVDQDHENSFKFGAIGVLTGITAASACQTKSNRFLWPAAVILRS